MKTYDLPWLIQELEKEEKIKYLFFWGHQPNKDGTIGQSCLSQWWVCDFEVEGKLYQSAEHWMMAEKARLFGDTIIEGEILAADSPALAKKLGRQVKNFDSQVWENAAYQIVVEGNKHKFSQNKDLKDYLLTTGNRILVEASPVDAIWGIGMAKDHKDVYNPQKWRGKNLLGFALMSTRDLLENIK